jgi:hypothetical protein
MSAKRYLYDKNFKACDNCRGRGTVRCDDCGGKGYREVRRSGHDSSNRCYSETERENCTQCHGISWLFKEYGDASHFPAEENRLL